MRVKIKNALVPPSNPFALPTHTSFYLKLLNPTSISLLTHVLSVETFVFSVDGVFSYKVVERRGISPPAGPTVRFPLAVPSYFVVNAVRGLTGDVAEVAKINFN